MVLRRGFAGEKGGSVLEAPQSPLGQHRGGPHLPSVGWELVTAAGGTLTNELCPRHTIPQ